MRFELYTLVFPTLLIIYIYDIGWTFPITNLIFFPLIIYTFYPLKYSSERYSNTIGSENTIIQCNYVKKIICIESSLLIISTIIFYFFSNQIFNTIYYIVLPNFSVNYIFLFPYFTLQAGSDFLYPVIEGLLWIALDKNRMDFNFYFAKACLKAMLDKRNELPKVNYFISAIESYNEFLHKNLKMEFNNLPQILSFIISKSQLQEADTINGLYKAFEINSLKPINYLLKMLDVHDDNQFLKRESLLKKIKDVVVFILGSLIPIFVIRV